VKIPDFLCFIWEKYKKENLLNIRPLFGHFWEYSAKIMPQICTAAFNFTRALLSYAAEESASWEHCWSQSGFRKTVLPNPNKGIPYLWNTCLLRRPGRGLMDVSCFILSVLYINRRQLFSLAF
jgi:hypothetical protein